MDVQQEDCMLLNKAWHFCHSLAPLATVNAFPYLKQAYNIRECVMPGNHHISKLIENLGWLID